MKREHITPLVAALLVWGPVQLVQAEECAAKPELKVVVVPDYGDETCSASEQVFSKPMPGWRYVGCEARECAGGCETELAEGRMTVVVTRGETGAEGQQRIRVRSRSKEKDAILQSQLTDPDDIGGALESIRVALAGAVPVASLGLDVTDSRGKPVAFLLKVDGREQGSSKDGSWKGSLAAGTYCVAVDASGHRPWVGPVRTGEGKATIKLEPAGSRASEPVRGHGLETPSGMTPVEGNLVRDPRSLLNFAPMAGGSFGTTAVSVDSFWIGETEVTWGAYQRCIDAGKCVDPCGNPSEYFRHEWNECRSSHAGKERHPINYIAGTQIAETFCRWVGGEVPTFSEWAWAYRGGRDQADYPWGSDPNNIEERACVDRGSSCEAGATPGDRSSQGVVDLYGNVQELVIASLQNAHTWQCGSSWNLAIHGWHRVMEGAIGEEEDTIIEKERASWAALLAGLGLSRQAVGSGLYCHTIKDTYARGLGFRCVIRSKTR